MVSVIVDGTPTANENVQIIESNPPDGAIDARQPSDPDGSDVSGWDSIELTFDGNVAELAPEDFVISVNPTVRPPEIVSVVTDGNTATLEYSDVIPLEAWTTIMLVSNGTNTRIGYLPADVNNDGLSNANDVLALIDALNGVGDSLAIYQTDIDRSGETNPNDVLRAIDLLNGAGAYDVWLGAALP